MDKHEGYLLYFCILIIAIFRGILAYHHHQWHFAAFFLSPSSVAFWLITIISGILLHISYHHHQWHFAAVTERFIFEVVILFAHLLLRSCL
jgi:hypothetical protein